METNYFEELIDLLIQEKKYDKEQHESLLLKNSLQERKAMGVTWFPISIKQSELGRGDYLTITLNKTNNIQEGHKFRFGMPVCLFSNHDPSQDRLNGIVAFVNRDTMRISFRIDELPDWSRRGKLGVDLLFDENSYKEMHAALIQAKELSANQENGKLIRWITAQETLVSNVFVPETPSDLFDPSLNGSQNQAIIRMLDERPLTILHGPPGTGKTTTLIKAVKALLAKNHKQILLVAPSNTAVDILTERLDAQGISVVRIGNPVRVSDHLQELTLDAKTALHPSNKEIKTLEKQARAYLDMGHKYKRSFGKSEREQRKALFNEAAKIRTEIDQIQDYVTQDILGKAEVITATLVGSNHHTIRERNYETVIIDEAAQALEPACWIPILKGNSIVLAGDHCQLPPTVKSNNKTKDGLYRTLFEKLVKLYPDEVALLDVQYRMHEQIMKYPSKTLYSDQLTAHPSVSNRLLVGDSSPVVFIDTAGASLEEIIVDDGIYNTSEATFLKMHLVELLEKLSKSYPMMERFPSIGVIVPYRRQSIFLKELIGQDEQIKPFLNAIQIHTIDSFQGQEKDIIYIGLTRSNSQQQIGFLSDIRRMNVAMTRAKRKLIVIGDSSTIGHHTFYSDFIDYVSEIDGYHTVWEWDMGLV